MANPDPKPPTIPKLVVKRIPLESIYPDPANARTHGQENLDAIVASLKRFGQAEPLVVQAGTRRIIGGHGRMAAMKALGWKECEVVELDVDDLQATSLGIALNRTGELATWDGAALSKILQELQTEDALDGVGYSPADLDKLLAELGQESYISDIDPDHVPEPPETPTTRPGDLWVMGNHRLLCGNSASAADVDRLLAGAQIHLVNTDPPYNVKVEPRSNNAIAAGLSSFRQTHHQKLDVERYPGKATPTTRRLRPKDRPLANDFVSDEAFNQMLHDWFGNMARVLMPGRGFYIWGGYANCGNYPPVMKEVGLYFSQAVIWVKGHPVLTRKDFMGNHEWCFYGWREGVAHHWYGPNNAVDVWDVKKVNPQSMIHLTEKPVELASRPIQYSSVTGENVLDLFGGSGSTLIAAEETRRKAFLMELDALYCDVIVNRWEGFTKKQAVLDGDGRTFTEITAERKEA